MKLKPCPFCGSETVAYDRAELAVVCLHCAASGPFAGAPGVKGKRAQRIAEDYWNNRRRVTFQAIPGVCVFCGCTDDHACEGGCSWINAEHTLCSACVPSLRCPEINIPVVTWSAWTAVADELPDDSTTVLMCNLVWDEPVQVGHHDGEYWFWEHLPAVPLDGIDCAGGHDCMTQPPTHWMHFPEPPGVAQVPDVPPPPAADRPRDFRVAYPNNPFAEKLGIVCGVEDRCRMIKTFGAMQCLDALALPDNGKVVTKALEVRLRGIEKQNRKGNAK